MAVAPPSTLAEDKQAVACPPSELCQSYQLRWGLSSRKKSPRQSLGVLSFLWLVQTTLDLFAGSHGRQTSLHFPSDILTSGTGHWSTLRRCEPEGPGNPLNWGALLKIPWTGLCQRVREGVFPKYLRGSGTLPDHYLKPSQPYPGFVST